MSRTPGRFIGSACESSPGVLDLVLENPPGGLVDHDRTRFTNRSSPVRRLSDLLSRAHCLHPDVPGRLAVELAELDVQDSGT